MARSPFKINGAILARLAPHVVVRKTSEIRGTVLLGHPATKGSELD